MSRNDDEGVVQTTETPRDPSSGGELVAIARYDQAIVAQIVCARLQAEGIPATIADEHLVQTNWLWSNAVGGVRLQAPAEHVDRALQIIAEIEASQYDLTEDDPLPEESPCDSAEAAAPTPVPAPKADTALYAPSAVRFALLSLVTLGVFPLYWLFRNFRAVDARSNGAKAPAATIMFFMFMPWSIPVLVYVLGKQIERFAFAKGIEKASLPSATLAAIYFALLLSLLYPRPYHWLYLCAGFAVLPINRLAAAVNRKSG